MAEHLETTAGIDPSDVILLQDKAFRPDRIDIELWLKTLFLPLVILSNGRTIIIPDETEAIAHLQAIWTAARKIETAGIRTRILSHVQPAPDLSIIASIRDRMSANGEVLASTSMTWTLMLMGDEWQVTQILFDEGELDRSVTARIYPR